jgi:hypothetical protein
VNFGGEYIGMVIDGSSRYVFVNDGKLKLRTDRFYKSITRTSNSTPE